MLSLLWQICDIIRIIFLFANGQILKNKLTIWSHWRRRPIPNFLFSRRSKYSELCSKWNELWSWMQIRLFGSFCFPRRRSPFVLFSPPPLIIWLLKNVSFCSPTHFENRERARVEQASGRTTTRRIWEFTDTCLWE